MTRKWRPSLGMVLGGALCGTLILSLGGLIVFRYLGPEIGFRNAAILIGVLITGATTALGWLLVRLLLRPITALEQFATQVRSNPAQPQSPPGHFGTRELRATAISVIDMAETLRNRESTIRAFTDHVTHELKTPVAALKAATELLQDDSGLARESRLLVGQIAGAGAQMEQQLDAMQHAARARETRHDGVCTLNDMSENLRLAFPSLELEIDDGDIAIPLAPRGMDVVLRQLLSNAKCHGGKKVHMSVKAEGTRVIITVHDNGVGISVGNASRIFDPFFTTNRDNGGTGMGLSIVRNTLRANGADIFLAPGDKGATFSICFGVS
ncbi:sensor histidine kinase [Aliiroseovarius sp. 2305UL8-7]|uniref:sensor histidine kinase n=1 Tax=Aliiroseovarius conchicola TaxID=3121637 RepID=UPI003528FAC3